MVDVRKVLFFVVVFCFGAQVGAVHYFAYLSTHRRSRLDLNQWKNKAVKKKSALVLYNDKRRAWRLCKLQATKPLSPSADPLYASAIPELTI